MIVETLQMSLKNKGKSNGPKTDPWGTLVITFLYIVNFAQIVVD